MHHSCTSRVPVSFLMLLACSLLSSCDTSPRHQTGCSFWQIVASPNPGNVADELSGVFALASDNIWVTGSFASTSTSTDNRTLVEHWNGKTWSVVPSSNPSPEGEGNYPDSLGIIAGSSANDIWAVGDGLGGFLEHWDGSAWRAVDTPAPPRSIYSYSFSSVSVLSPSDAWVVGHAMERTLIRGDGNGDLALTAHWDGKAWSIVSNPNLHADLNGTELADVVALAPDNVWAVGSTSSIERGQLALIEHWNGKAWSVVSNPQPGGTDSKGTAALWSLAPLSPSDIWAAGFYELPGAVSMHYLVEHWDGRSWSIVPTPTPARKLDNLRHIVAISDHDVWALTYNGSLLHWNGKFWRLSTLPNADQDGYSVSNLAALPNGQVWLVGAVHDPTGPGPRTLIARSVQSCS